MLPPGSGKTLIGAEIARRIGRPVVVLTPNTAIQGQWSQLWRSLAVPGGGSVTVTEDRSLSGDITVLTYQSIATFDDDETESGAFVRSARRPAGCIRKQRGCSTGSPMVVNSR